MDFWTPEQIEKFIGIEQAFEEFCGADPVLGTLDSTKPDPERDPKKFKKWYARYCPVQDDATSRFLELFREKILVAMVWHDDKELVLPPEYWAITLASLTIMKGKVQGMSHDDPYRHLENCRVVLRREEWEKWINGNMPDTQQPPHKAAPNLTPKPSDKEEKPEPVAPQAHDAQPSTPAKADQAQTYDKLKDWFVKIYMPAHEEDSPNPTRDAALSAAKLKFPNYCDQTHLRDDLRTIWRNHAPKGWKKTGPRAKSEK